MNDFEPSGDAHSAGGVDSGVDDDDDYYRRFKRENRPRRGAPRRRNVLPALVLLVVAVLVVAGGSYGYGQLKSHFASAPDYAGPGSGQVVFEVKQGETITGMGRGLVTLGVVRSVDAFVHAARKEPRSSTIQVGFYPMKKKMDSAGAVAVLINPKNQLQSVVTVPEGSRISTIVKIIVAKTDFTRATVLADLKQSRALGLPASAKGNPEGYLFPATYTVTPDMNAEDLLREMVAKTVQVDDDLGVAAGAKKLGMTPEQILTVASILEFEASRDQDYPKVARAIYNRLDIDMALQSDATVAYANNKSGTVYTTSQEREIDSPYNTYKNTGLPPGPIGSPGERTIKAALHPAKGDQLYWVVVNLKTGETRYADTYEEHLKNVALFRKYCKTSNAC